MKKILKLIFCLFLLAGVAGIIFTMKRSMRSAQNEQAINTAQICQNYPIGVPFNLAEERKKLETNGEYSLSGMNIQASSQPGFSSLEAPMVGAQVIYLVGPQSQIVCRLQIKDRVIVGR